MVDRTFLTESVKYGEGMRPAVVIKCGHPGCKTTDELHVSTHKGPNPAHVKRYFRNRGWRVGRCEGKDMCPEHARKQKQGKTEVKPTQTTATPATKAVPPRIMDRDDRRIIFAKLNDVYVEGRGYDAPWTDVKVAEDLNVPPAWVADVRVDFFGDIAENGDITEFQKVAAVLEESVMNLAKDIDALDTARQSIGERMARLGKTLDEVKELRKRIEQELSRGRK